MLHNRIGHAVSATLQGERHSMAYFANVRATTVLQGPLNKYPPITFPQILATKAKKRKELNLKPRDQMTDQEKLARWKEAHGPDFVKADAAVTPQPPALGDTSALDQPAPAIRDAIATCNGGVNVNVSNGSETNVMQGDRHSMAYFANARGSTLLQGPKKKYPPITFPEILAEKRRQMDEVNFREDMTDEEKLDINSNRALGPEFQTVDMTHSGKPEYEPVALNESGEPVITPMAKGKLAPEMEHLKLQSAVAAAAR